MKIRNGFVANSSSSSFIVVIPEKFDITKVDLDRYLDQYLHWGGKLFKDNVVKAFEKLKEENELWHTEGDGESHLLKWIFEDLGFIVDSMETNDGGKIVLIPRVKIDRIMKILKDWETKTT